jgi:transposase-like protein
MTQLPFEKPELFEGRHFNHLLIIQAVRWYITYKLSYRDVCDLTEERGVTVVHTTVLRWVQCLVPVFEKKWKNYARPVGSSWRVDETYIKVKGQWRYLYRAVDEQGQIVDFLRECGSNTERNRVGKQNQKRTVQHIGDHRSRSHDPAGMVSSACRVMRS